MGTETLVLNPDGYFRHTVRSNAKVLVDEPGHWEWDKEMSDEDHDIVDIDGFTNVGPDTRAFGIWPATVEKYRGRVRLVVNRDLGLYLYKQPR